MKQSRQVDAYIGKAPEFAQPILEKIRKAFHAGCPSVEETIKWGVPYFMYKGVLGGMAAFKQHVGFGFWKSKLLDDPERLFETGQGAKASMCNAHIKSVKDLPSHKVLSAYVKAAAKLNDDGIKVPKRRTAAAMPEMPAQLLAALNKNKKAKTTFERFAPSHRREYLEWICEAKRDETRQKRIATTIEWLKEGKHRNWKYEGKC
jgi:uncharacterized protein YdeI (YjbR/CyaY-like superfamily)